ncbi:MAG: V-type ATP synthase subunit A [Clostridiales bacterium]|jgi:V/A-type H+-transporting ATPase subunit A|nr:V-type ATP synthase subunit A [Clostridiales bacterium]
MEVIGTVYSINGPVVKTAGSKNFKMYDQVFVGNERLIGEVIGIDADYTVVQVYENTTGLQVGEPVVSTGRAMSVTLGPGIIGGIFDGIERPLNVVEEKSGAFIGRGLQIDLLDTAKKWRVELLIKAGDTVRGGDIIAKTQETEQITHWVTVPPKVCGTVTEVVPNGEYTVTDALARVQSEHGEVTELKLAQEWPIRIPRPYRDRVRAKRPLTTGQRVIDTLFPLAKGGTAAIPGGFGTGKTMTQHQLAKWSDADIIIYIGCGERGNEMTQVLEEFTALTDPGTNRSLMGRTALIANTSNMPVAAREASIYTGITLAEYYRDMGYHVAIMADSTSRWAEALREISGRLEEMPAEEGFPAYLSSRLAAFYERAGYVHALCGKEGSVTIIGAVSPQGGDFSEPVTQNTKRFVRAFLALDRQLAYARHYPAINWLSSYSEYADELGGWYEENVDVRFMGYRRRVIRILQEEAGLNEIVKLIGSDVLPDDQKLVLEIAKTIRTGFLQQNAYHADDTYVPIKKQFLMMEIILYLNDKLKEITAKSIPISQVMKTGIFEEIVALKYNVGNEEFAKFDGYKAKIDGVCRDIIAGNEVVRR